MPLLKLETTVALPPAQRGPLLKRLSSLAAEIIGKPEQYVMVLLTETDILMGAESGPAAFVDLRSIGGLDADKNRKLTEAICDVLESDLHISPERTYVTFTDISAAHWGWNGATFG